MRNTVSVRKGRERGGKSMGMERQRLLSIIHEEEVLLCSGGWCPQPVMNGYQARAAGTVSEHSLLRVKDIVQEDREWDEMGIWAKEVKQRKGKVEERNGSFLGDEWGLRSAKDTRKGLLTLKKCCVPTELCYIMLSSD